MISPRPLITLLLVSAFAATVTEAIGVNWGTTATRRLPPATVVQMMRDNGITKVKLFDTDDAVMSALAGSGVEVMVGIPNGQLSYVSRADGAAEWVRRNVKRYIFHGGVDIRYVAVGNEPFLASYNGSLLGVTLPALRSIQTALDEAGFSDIKSTIPFNSDVYGSPQANPVPSAGRFRSDIEPLMTEIVRFLVDHNSPFTVNIYPFLGLYLDKNFPFEFAFFDGKAAALHDNGKDYTNFYDANFDTLVAALAASNAENMTIIVGEVGWPTDGDVNANATLAKRFYDGLLRRLAAKQGTPRQPGQHIETYLFGLIDEDAKSVAPGNFERHWGIFRYDGQPKFAMDLAGQGRDTMLVGAKNIKYLASEWCVLNPDAADLSKLGDSIGYACTYADCTSLGYGCGCHGMDLRGNASYAFNAYFQAQGQAEGSCDFEGLAVVTTQNASRGGCNFAVQIDLRSPAAAVATSPLTVLMYILVGVLGVI